MSDNYSKKDIYSFFNKLTKEDVQNLNWTLNKAQFGDCSISLIYAWCNSFNYAVRYIKSSAVILEKGIDKELDVILLIKDKRDIEFIISDLYCIFNKYDVALKIDYVSEGQLDLFTNAISNLGKKYTVRYNIEDSDYIYKTQDFLDSGGKSNRNKRAGINYIERAYPNITVKSHNKNNNLIYDSLYIFDVWCKNRDCSSCIYGCEKDAFIRFMEVFDESSDRLWVSFSDNTPLSFALSQVINDNMECYYFQKNIKPIRGLMYWLNREMALDYKHIDYINLGEDMGLEGLRYDKKSLRPIFLKNKYCIKIEMEKEGQI